MQPKPPDVRQSLSLKQTLPHDWPPGDGVGAGAGFDGFTKFHWAVLGIPYLELHSVPPLTDDPSCVIQMVSPWNFDL